MLNIIVLVKQVPDTKNITEEAMTEDGIVNRAALPTIFNPEDLNALEAALEIKDKMNAKVTVITMGPPDASEVLKQSLYRGADDVILISDRKFANADTIATSYTLSMAIKKIGKYDLVFAGRQAIDGDTAQVGPQTAEKLGINQITFVSELKEVNKNSVVAVRSIDGGNEVIKSKLPVLLTFTEEANDPRPASAKKIMKYKNIPVQLQRGDNSELTNNNVIKQWDIVSINADENLCGLKGSPTKIKEVHNVVLKGSDVKMIENTEESINSMMQELIKDHIIG